MNSKFLILALLLLPLFYQSFSYGNCDSHTYGFECGPDCKGTPSCGSKTCGNVKDMCYCNCNDLRAKCKTSELGYKWNGGIKLADGSYALNGTKGDGKNYKC
jgi:hypothetical protein